MRFEGSFDVAAPRSRVWAFFVDPEQVAACAPDVQELQVIDATHFRVKVRAGIGAIRTAFAFEVEFADLHPPERASVRATGRAPGNSVAMSNSVELVEVDAGRTIVRWAADVVVSGAIANVGARFIQAAADKTTRDVFDCIKVRLEAP
jgi:carbon monoxide dehydrogenase subunit G